MNYDVYNLQKIIAQTISILVEKLSKTYKNFHLLCNIQENDMLVIK